MSIDEAIEHGIDELEWIKSTGIYPYGNTQDKLHTDDYIDVVIAILRKYQKIEEIVGNYGFDTSWICLKKIREVIEDGNDD